MAWLSRAIKILIPCKLINNLVLNCSYKKEIEISEQQVSVYIFAIALEISS